MKRLLGISALLLALSACGTTNASSDNSSSNSDSSSSDSSTEEDAGTPLTRQDITVGIKIRAKQCFGSAGCNVTYRVAPEVSVFGDLDGTYDVTYEVRGIEDGPAINTFSIEPDGTASVQSEEDASTASAGAKLRAVVTSVELQQ